MSGIVVNHNEKKIEIIGMSIDEGNVYSFISSLPEENQEDAVSKAMTIGCIGLKNMDLAQNIDYVQKEFNELISKFERENAELRNRLADLLNIDDSQRPLGRFKLLFEDYFDLERGRICNLLDPFIDGAPIQKLRNDLLTNINEIKEMIIKEQVLGKAVSMTTLKGGQFEENVLRELQIFSNPFKDSIEHVGNKQGKTGKTGDIIIDIDGDLNKRVVIECKDSSSYTAKTTIQEIELAIKNRDAKFGIFLFNCFEQLPRELFPLKIGNNYIVCAYENDSLYFAYRLSRIVLEKKKLNEGMAIDIDRIQEEIERISQKLNSINDSHKDITSINNAGERIKKNLDILKRDIEEGLGRILESINSST